MSLIQLCYDSTPAKTESNFLPNTFPFGGFVRRKKAALQYIDCCLRVSFRANGRSVDSGRDKHQGVITADGGWTETERYTRVLDPNRWTR